MLEQIVVALVIVGTLILFIDGRVRYEFVALAGLLLLGLMQILSADEIFSGFSHPAVITVGAVLVVNQALLKSGFVDRIIVFIDKKKGGILFKLAILMAITGFLSAFMNNVGALALLLPVAIKIAEDNKVNPSKLLMPVAFASLLGGKLTAIGTPPNLIVSTYRQEITGQPFEFFEFTFIGLILLIVGILFTVTIGVKLLPDRENKNKNKMFNIGEYLSEVVVTKDSKLVGKAIKDLYLVFKLEVEVLSVSRGQRNIIVPLADEILLEGDQLVIKADARELAELINKTGLNLVGAKLDRLESQLNLRSDDFTMVEVVLRDDSILIGRTPVESRLRNRYNVNLVAAYRKGIFSIFKLKDFRFRPGDVLLLQAPEESLQDIYHELGCLPLAGGRLDIRSGKKLSKHKEVMPLAIFMVGVILVTIGIMPVQLAFSLVALILVLTKLLTAREFYDSIEWPTLILLASLLPLGTAIQKSGLALTIAEAMVGLSSFLSPAWLLIVLMVLCMVLTNLISSTATAIIMGPIALGIAEATSLSPDPFLMGVCFAASASYLTPIAHQSNMLVMGPGNYKFTDYWRLGLPISLFTLVIGGPLILFFWSF